MVNDEDKLTTLLSHVTIGTLDESLSRQLNSTHLSKPSSQQQRSNDHTATWTSTLPTQSISQLPSWQMSSPTVANSDEEGWGDAPAYTSFLPNTYFGFSSIMLPSNSGIPPSTSSNSTQGYVSLDPNQPFSRYRHQPVSFTSLTSTPSHDIFETK
ncbi:hypothetical protein BC941DRAFT_121249 [Chlamydoabsidia padenii]|nr:hypothetical protein BC941DRAFT_121249 [Chlamydoabsidia padenii]